MSVIISLGTNLGERRRNITTSIELLKSIINIKKISSIYMSKPAFNSFQPTFFNLAIHGDTELSPYQLLREIKRFEFLMGRRETHRFAPRIIDMDILIYGETVINLPYLKIPHPGLLKRDFFLIPAIEVCPLCIHPVNKKPLKNFSPEIKTILKKLK